MIRKKLAIDLGNDNIKIAGMDDNNNQVLKLIKSKATTDSLDSNYVVNYNNRNIYFGVGNPLIKSNKVEREYIIETIFLALSQITECTKDTIILDLAIGLPLELYKSTIKETYETNLRQQYCNKLLSAKINNNNINIIINSIQIFAEGYSGYLAIYDYIDITDNLISIIEIGYKTTDVITISIDGNNIPHIDNYTTIDKGTYNINNDILQGIINTTQNKLSLSTIESALIPNNNPLIKVNLDNTIKHINVWDYTHHASATVNNIFNEIELKMPDIRTRTNYLIGGGNVLVDDIINNHINTNNKLTRIDTLIFDDTNLSIFANVLGYYMQIGEQPLNIDKLYRIA